MRRYLDTDNGKEEVEMLKSIMAEADKRKYPSLLEGLQINSEITQEIDKFFNRRMLKSLREQLLDLFTSFCESHSFGHDADTKKSINEILMRKEVVEEELVINGKQFRKLVCNIGVNTEDNIDEHFIDATFVNDDYDYDPFVTHKFDVFHNCTSDFQKCALVFNVAFFP